MPIKKPNTITKHTVKKNLKPVSSISKVSTSAQENSSDWRDMVVVIDPGHGGVDPGATAANGIQEKSGACYI